MIGVGVYFAVPTHYTADVSIVLASPVNGGTINSDKSKQGLTNPFLSFNDALKTGASIVILSMNTQDVWTQLGAPKDGPTEITIDDGRTNPNVLDISGPYIYISVDSDSPAKATSVLTAARKRVASELFKWQRALGAPANTFITSTDIVPPAKPEADFSSNWQNAIGAAVLCLIAGLAVAYGVTRRGAHPRPAGRERERPWPVTAIAPAAPVVAAAPAVPAVPFVPIAAPVQAAEEPMTADEPGEPVREPELDEDSSVTMEFPIYRPEALSSVPVPWAQARQDDGGK
ncbi:hypothetical protein [Nonomuraea zeae]|uniref:Uncharacterized protein n=1 Tax=Nonomuraea zeae TaxID=1642303 RepID=A0A5S4G8G7_9ACTN|nr:hypothetical protein [Nonomuraea zeae]TMR29296.1 hypothetical protein ETD85_32905 [Nonomuraea zeae]